MDSAPFSLALQRWVVDDVDYTCDRVAGRGLVDCLVCRAEMLAFRGESYRLKCMELLQGDVKEAVRSHVSRAQRVVAGSQMPKRGGVRLLDMSRYSSPMS